MKRFLSFITFAVLIAGQVAAEDHQLPNQPKAVDGGYIVQWDCTANGGQGAFASANTMEYNETFIIAVNLHGTALGEWVMAQPSAPQYTRGVVLNMMRDDQGQEYADNGARLWHIRDTIFGATVNFKQLQMKNGSANNNPSNNQRTQIHARLFGHETAFGACAGSVTTQSSKGWWQWSDGGANGWPSTGSWTHGYIHRNTDNYFFQFAPYTGTKSATTFTTISSDHIHDQWYDKDHRVNANGFASPFGSASPCPRNYTTDYALSTTATTVCPLSAASKSATISTTGSMADYTYLLYCDGMPVAGSSRSGNNGALSWTTQQPGTYTVWYYKTADGNTPVLMTPCSGASEITLTYSANCQDCPNPVNIPYPNLTYNLNADAFPIELAAASGTNVTYQWYYYTDANTTPQVYTGEGAQTNNCVPATSAEGKTYYYCMVYSDECPDGVVYCNTADVTVQACQTFNSTTFTLTSTSTTYDAGTQIVLTANFSGYGGEHTYVWTLNGTPIDSSATHQIVQDFQKSTLTIPAAAVADGGTYSVTIYDGPNCSKNATRTITVNAVDPQEPEERVTELTVCKDEPVVLRADADGHLYTWNTGETTQQITVTPTTVGTEIYTVRAYDYKVETSDNLMANGDFENYTDYHQKPAGFTSDYEYLAFSPTASGLYDTYGGKNGVYLLSCDAKNTWRDYAQVKPHGGQYFAMFDAAQSGFAWKATTTNNPNMKLQKGGVYIFSYWAADLNEADQRQHPAELQFSINYKDDATGQMTKEYLGQKMVLGQDNKWHYSETYWTAPCNSSYIEIGVEDLNDYAGVGNDFGLDDIIFQMIKNEKSTGVDRQKWILTVEDCTPEECVGDRIYRKWNDLLFVDNADKRYTSYQWYADGVALAGATGQFYYEENKVLQGDGHEYYCVATTTTGTKETMCAQLFENFPTSISAGRQPAPSQVRVYTPTGKLVFTGADVEEIRGKLNPGFYMVHHTNADGEAMTEKLLIH